MSTDSSNHGQLPKWAVSAEHKQLKKGTAAVPAPHWKRENWKTISTEHLSVFEIGGEVAYVVTDSNGETFAVTAAMLRVLAKRDAALEKLVRTFSVSLEKCMQSKRAADIATAERSAEDSNKRPAVVNPFEPRALPLAIGDVLTRLAGVDKETIKRDLAEDRATCIQGETLDGLAASLASQFMDQAKSGREIVKLGAPPKKKK